MAASQHLRFVYSSSNVPDILVSGNVDVYLAPAWDKNTEATPSANNLSFADDLRSSNLLLQQMVLIQGLDPTCH